jgi:hypothetical protein
VLEPGAAVVALEVHAATAASAGRWAAAATHVVDGSAAAVADRSADPMLVKSLDAEAKSSGEANTKGAISASIQGVTQLCRKLQADRLLYACLTGLERGFTKPEITRFRIPPKHSGTVGYPPSKRCTRFRRRTLSAATLSESCHIDGVIAAGLMMVLPVNLVQICEVIRGDGLRWFRLIKPH